MNWATVIALLTSIASQGPQILEAFLNLLQVLTTAIHSLPVDHPAVKTALKASAPLSAHQMETADKLAALLPPGSKFNGQRIAALIQFVVAHPALLTFALNLMGVKLPPEVMELIQQLIQSFQPQPAAVHA